MQLTRFKVAACCNHYAGTHDVVNVVVNGIQISTVYSEHADARGALFSIVREDSESIELIIPLNRSVSGNYTLPFTLYPGQYRVFVYDIEQDGTLYSGVSYPAVMQELFISNKSSQGT